MPSTISHLLGGLALGCLLAGSAHPQNPAPAPETAAAPIIPQTPLAEGVSAQSSGAGSEAETTATPDSSLVVIRFSPLRDAAAARAADSLKLTAAQRQAFFQAYAEGVATALRADPSGGKSVVDSVRGVVVEETGRKVRFVRQARLIFADMYARRARDKARAPGTEEELWRSAKNVECLIALYRDEPNASDVDFERAMTRSFDR